MHLSNYFLPTTKETPKDAQAKSHILMLKSGMIRQISSGIYSFLPMGLKVLKKIEGIVRQEMNNIGANELLMPCIQPVDIWKESGRYGNMEGEMLKILDRNESELTFSPSAEEAITSLMRDNIQSYNALPEIIYQIQWKFRDEIRPRSGIMRAREFFMKDAYSFHMTEENALLSYAKIFKTYLKIYKRLGLTAIPVFADTGTMGGNYSHEFHVLANEGHSEVFYDERLPTILSDANFSLNDLGNYYAVEESKRSKSTEKELTQSLINVKQSKAIELGHIFYYGQKYSKLMNFKIQDASGTLKQPYTGAYGIGISRIMAACTEVFADEVGMIWPSEISPFDLIILNLDTKDDKCKEMASSIYNAASNMGLDVLYDDTSASPGAKFSKADLLGIPHIATIGKKINDKIIIKNRKTGQKTELSQSEVINFLTSHIHITKS